MTKFGEYLEKEFLRWQTASGQRRTLNAFAKYLDVSPQILSMWINGTRRPGADNIAALVTTLGIEVYEALDLPRPDPLLIEIQRRWPELSDEDRTAILTILRQDPDPRHDTKPRPTPKPTA